MSIEPNAENQPHAARLPTPGEPGPEAPAHGGSGLGDAYMVTGNERPSPRSITLGVAFMATILLLSGLAVLPAPYVVKSPGPTRDTLGQVDGKDLIEITGATTYPSTGELLLTTVGVGGGPGYPVNLAQVVQGWVSDTRAVFPVEEVFPPDVTREESAAESAAEMSSSQENATYAALTELGYDIPVSVQVAATVEGSQALGHVDVGDTITSLDAAPVTSPAELIEAMTTIEPGTTVTLGLIRDGAPVEASFATTAPTDGGTGSRLGIQVRSAFDFPVDVQIQIDDIGGPSAGTMFALGIIDRLTPEDEVNGQVIAGTGTMDTTGTVGAIGGIRQKLNGALRDGATWFLAPASNCNEVVGHVPDGLRVVKVSTLAEARAAMTAIGAGDGGSLPTCTS
ncbi:PDZ domain-containing protein [Sanguibacter gelidistatuariae]|uniref:PDZ domain-containing protein n=1 Tax=Sanguibacter gelidistatuariae TaxID=1814289 RepID=A0A1G6L3R6_9MICO|nr:PDZ domain-containing protein [Sanguibacter gelidistatuariae]SDC37783.1 PDZ domain-containing protein [Sanguibacter gelidistatuariae]